MDSVHFEENKAVKLLKLEDVVLKNPSFEPKRKIYDAVHGFIHFNEIERKLMGAEAFQRLHYIHQLGIAYVVYPGATHTRFEHSLGTMELATRIFEKIAFKNFHLEEAGYWKQIIRFAALCHDLGHLPFSHDAESILLGKAGHEEWTKKAIESEELKQIWSFQQNFFPHRSVEMDVLKMAIGEKKLQEMGVSGAFSPVESVLSQVVTGDFFGADRIDYLLRDAQCTGVSYGLFDYHQLIEMLSIVEWEGRLQLGIEEDGVASCEALLLARHFMHQRVYQYSSVKAFKFHLCRFMGVFFSEKNYLKNLPAYLSLTDCEILVALRKAAKDPGAPGHADADALLGRERRFKAIFIKEGIETEELKSLQKALSIPPEAIHFESVHSKEDSKALRFPVQRRSGSISSGEECSKIALQSKRGQWVYLAPEYEKIWRGAIEKWL